MVLGLLKWLKGTRFYERKKKNTIKTYPSTKGKFTLRTKEGFMNFWIKEKLMLRVSGGKRRSFSTQEVGRKIIFP